MQAKRAKYPVGIQTFENIINEGYLYVDKTRYIRMLVDRGKYYFLSRPRRFGKSLFLSTLEAYFRGKRELFNGLQISESETAWEEYPVVHIDFASMDTSSVESLAQRLMLQLGTIATSYGLEIPTERDAPDSAFEYVVASLHHKYGKGVVILIDEYDKGIIETLQDEEMNRAATSMLRPFFSVLKSHDRYIHFAFITGVSRFRNTTLFSGFNNPADISLQTRYSSICGITKDELIQNFQQGISDIAENYDISIDKTVESLLDKYDGYRFTKKEEYVCNPFSILNTMSSAELMDYWVMSGTSKVLVDYLKGSKFSIDDMSSRWVSENELGSTYSTENPLSLFFQTGYLTIRDYDGHRFYKLGIPNEEVQACLTELLVPEYVDFRNSGDLNQLRYTINKSIREGDVDTMMESLRSLVSSVPYHEIDTKLLEKHFHLCMYLIFMMLGTNTRSEVASAAGRADMVAQTPWRVYVFEFKIDGNADKALRQIDEKGYSLQWEAGDRKVTKIGVNFSSTLRTIDRWAFSD